MPLMLFPIICISVSQFLVMYHEHLHSCTRNFKILPSMHDFKSQSYSQGEAHGKSPFPDYVEVLALLSGGMNVQFCPEKCRKFQTHPTLARLKNISNSSTCQNQNLWHPSCSIYKCGLSFLNLEKTTENLREVIDQQDL